MLETWHKINHFPDYSVSSVGRVRRDVAFRHVPAGLMLSPSSTKFGHKGVTLTDYRGRRRRKLVHRLVAEAFIGEIPKGMVVNHLNSDPADNCVSNLEICTTAENLAHARAAGRMKDPPKALSADQKTEIMALYRKGLLQRELAAQFSVSQAVISNAVREMRTEAERAGLRRGRRPSISLDHAKTIRRRAAKGERQSVIAREFGVTQGAIYNIVRYKTHLG